MHLGLVDRFRQPYSLSVIIFAAALGCGACTSTAESAAEADSAEQHRAESAPETTTAIYELGEFNPDHEEFVVFDPCTEITWADLQEVGFVETIGDPQYNLGMSAACSFARGEPEYRRSMVTLTGDKVPYDRIVERGLLLDPAPESELPGVYTHHMGSEIPDSCTAAVHTNKGRFTVQFMDGELKNNHEKLCAIAIEHLEQIHEQTGGVENGNQS